MWMSHRSKMLSRDDGRARGVLPVSEFVDPPHAANLTKKRLQRFIAVLAFLATFAVASVWSPLATAAWKTVRCSETKFSVPAGLDAMCEQGPTNANVPGCTFENHRLEASKERYNYSAYLYVSVVPSCYVYLSKGIDYAIKQQIPWVSSYASNWSEKKTIGGATGAYFDGLGKKCFSYYRAGPPRLKGVEYNLYGYYCAEPGQPLTDGELLTFIQGVGVNEAAVNAGGDWKVEYKDIPAGTTVAVPGYDLSVHFKEVGWKGACRRPPTFDKYTDLNLPYACSWQWEMDKEQTKGGSRTLFFSDKPIDVGAIVAAYRVGNHKWLLNGPGSLAVIGHGDYAGAPIQGDNGVKITVYASWYQLEGPGAVFPYGFVYIARASDSNVGGVHRYLVLFTWLLAPKVPHGEGDFSPGSYLGSAG